MIFIIFIEIKIPLQELNDLFSIYNTKHYIQNVYIRQVPQIKGMHGKL